VVVESAAGFFRWSRIRALIWASFDESGGFSASNAGIATAIAGEDSCIASAAEIFAVGEGLVGVACEDACVVVSVGRCVSCAQDCSCAAAFR